MKRGLFITLEGIDGTGKSTQLRLLVQHLKRRGLHPLVTREPGGTKLGERLRQILLDSNATHVMPLAELALMYAARAQHLEEVIRPALAKGDLVLSDRYNDASFAYQGYGRELGVKTVRAFDRLICGRTQPDLSIVLDLAPRLSRERTQSRGARRKSTQERFELQGESFHKRGREGYLAIARRAPGRVKVVDAGGAVEEVHAEIAKLVDDFLGARDWGLGARERQAGRVKGKG